MSNQALNHSLDDYFWLKAGLIRLIKADIIKSHIIAKNLFSEQAC
jgi:hypothetical protein